MRSYGAALVAALPCCISCKLQMSGAVVQSDLNCSWNSAIFMPIPTLTYTAVFTTEDYPQVDASWGNENLDRIRSNVTKYEQLNNTQCIER